MKFPPKLRKLIDGLQCGIDAIHCDYTTGEVTMYLPAYHCTDMDGAIAYAIYHFPDVKVILTMSGSKPDVVYLRSGAEWEAKKVRRKANSIT